MTTPDQSSSPDGLGVTDPHDLWAVAAAARPKASCSGVTDWAVRIGRHLTPDGSVIVPPRIAAWIEKHAGVTSEWCIALRDTDAPAYAVLAALHLSALQHRSGIGTKLVGVQSGRQESKTWLTTVEAADALGVTDRAVRKRIATGRIPAARIGGRWLIRRNHLYIPSSTPDLKGTPPQCPSVITTARKRRSPVSNGD